ARTLKSELIADARIPEGQSAVLVTGALCLLFLAGVSLYCGIVIIRPFHKLSDFADKLAGGYLELPLEYERTNYFGRFTWAFDSMRREILRARVCEREAVENQKTVIAALSHDIKTPVASIRAYTEALELGIGSSPEKCRQYTEVIVRKCDELSKLTSDLLTHSLTELERLKMSPEEFELGELLSKAVADISPDGNVELEMPAEKTVVYADPERVVQITENLINNAKKYAGTGLKITAERNGNMAEIHFRDYGRGVPDKDMPFIFDKFYRGSNSRQQSGAGLGLYIVRYIAEQSGGSVSCRNTDNGFEVTVSLPLKK
ncbi:MAG: HAMP domain-containing histidine kinase, partial [Ruminococcus sp.]|nr:HAMP domain-containing histidine kinase [Ruminococcus sp.]